MWKKDEAQEMASQSPRPVAPTQRPDPPTRPAPSGERATIGRSITIHGDVTGDEDLVIQGRIEGTVDLKQHSVTVGPEGKVKAAISGRVVTVEGEVTGDVKAQEQAILRNSARVDGDIVSPRVVIEDGATFRGSIDMSAPERAGRVPTVTAPRPSPEPTTTGTPPSGGNAGGGVKP